MEIDDHSSSLRVASFSCYLDKAKESLVHRVSAQDNNNKNNSIIKFSNKDMITTKDQPLRVDSFSCLNSSSSSSSIDPAIQDPTSAFSFSHQTPKLGGVEIGVFGADRYFNMKLEYQTGAKNTNHIQTRPPTTNINLPPTSTRSICSESTSCNSQTILLPNFQQNQSQMKQKKAMATRLFMGFGCRGPCFDKKSVHIHQTAAQRPLYAGSKKPSRTGSERVDPEAAAKTKQLILEEARRSIEVFGSQNRSLKGDVATNMERKLSMLTWDAIPKGRNLPTSAASTTCDDMASDASSDLFEIENVSGTIYPLLLPPEAAATAADGDGDDLSSCMSPASVYAPSEASIQWSVITASAADYSALSEFNDDSVSVAAKKTVAQRGLKTMNNIQGGKEVQKITKPAAGFLGCKNHKAVDVAQNVCVKTKD